MLKLYEKYKIKQKGEKNEKTFKKKTSGITLIALVITIIVLLILAGIAISMLTGENSILQKVTVARKRAEEASIEDQKRLAMIAAATNINGETYTETKTENEETTTRTARVLSGLALMSSGENQEIKVNSITTGLVAVDNKGNEYVWIEVPKSIYRSNSEFIPSDKQSPSDSSDYDNIEAILKNYSSAYNSIGYGTDGDEWYGWNDVNRNNTCDEGEILTKAMAEDDETGNYKKNNKGCGLTYDEYYELKHNMLKSVYENGGFWIGRYEAGTNVVRTSGTGYEAFSQMNKYPYFYVTCSQAQKLSSKMSPSNNTTSSLMFGVQWNLVLKFIETQIGNEIKNSDNKNILTQDSSNWGNYKSVSFALDRGKYWVSGKNWSEYTTLENNLKPASSKILTTGATERNKMLNIYDLAGNVWEWTLQHGIGSDVHPCSYRGGFYDNMASVAYRDWRRPDRNATYYGFRNTLY